MVATGPGTPVTPPPIPTTDRITVGYRDGLWCLGADDASTVGVVRLDVGGAVLPLSLALPVGPVLGGVVALHPSDDPSRDQPLLAHLAATLPRHGVAVLLHDRRPCPDGDVPLEVQAADALAVAARLREQVGDVPVGMWGWSQGGWAAALAASIDTSVACLVVVGSVGVSPAAQMRHGSAEHLRRAGFNEDDVAQLVAARRTYEAGLRGEVEAAEVQRSLDEVAARPWRDLAWLPQRFPGAGAWGDRDLEPEPVFAATACPVLAVWGEDDPWVPVDASEAAWRRAAQERLTVLRLSGTGHGPRTDDPRYESALVAHVRRCLAAGADFTSSVEEDLNGS